MLHLQPSTHRSVYDINVYLTSVSTHMQTLSTRLNILSVFREDERVGRNMLQDIRKES